MCGVGGMGGRGIGVLYVRSNPLVSNCETVCRIQNVSQGESTCFTFTAVRHGGLYAMLDIR